MSYIPPKAPAHLNGESRDLWAELVAAYEFEPHELKTLRLALEALDRATSARKRIRRHGLTYEDRFGAPHVRPEVAIERDARLAWVRLMAALDIPVDDAPEQSRTTRGQFGDRAKGRVKLAKAAV